MGTLLIIAGLVYFATLVFVVMPLCCGIIFNTWREVMRQDKE